MYYYKFTDKGMASRLKAMHDARNALARKDIRKLHVKLQPGNSKTGRSCWTVSLLPVIDCGKGCHVCKNSCYDLRNDCRFDATIKDRAKNSIIHKEDPQRYWTEIDMLVKANYAEQVRINVGGDLTDEDFAYVAKLGRQNKQTDFLFFTKNYDGINTFLDHHRFPKNVKPILSAWPGLELKNPHNLPVSHVLFPDGTTTAPEFGAYFCQGNCSKCHFEREGCWVLKKGENVLFEAH